MLTQFETKEFTFQGRAAKILYPSCPSNGRLILKTEYFDAFPTFEVAMLKKRLHAVLYVPPHPLGAGQ